MKFLLDTCVLSELVKSVPEARVLRWVGARKPHELFISAMTWGELQRGVERLPGSRRRTELTLWLQRLQHGLEDRILAFDSGVAEVWAQMTARAEMQGQPMAAFDSIIAATARAHGCELVTRNVRALAFAGLGLINPWQGQ